MGAVVNSTDTGLYDLLSQAVPELNPADWAHFVINTYPAKNPQVAFFEGQLNTSHIRIRGIHKVDVGVKDDVGSFLDRLLEDIRSTLGNIDQQIFASRMDSLRALSSTVSAFATNAAEALPKANVVQPDYALLTSLFDKTWEKTGLGLKTLVDSYRHIRHEPDQEFINTLEKVFTTLERGSSLPNLEQIRLESAAGGLMKWHADKMNELRVEFANAFESIDECLNAGFAKLRNDMLEVLREDTGGGLACLAPVEAFWDALIARWEGHQGETVMVHAIRMLVSASLSFRGFIQPRVRGCLDVLDSDSPTSKDYCFTAGDLEDASRDKLEMAWQNACFNCRTAIESMAKEPAMARFAAAEDFREAILRSGGESKAKELWRQFYLEVRADVWPEQFARLEGETRLRKEWDHAVRTLRDSAAGLAGIA